ncbi:MAG TPA: hypothetical protein VIG46_06070 [Candidatus Baltobacteraceae bacterium]|jgi:hypothetical protein
MNSAFALGCASVIALVACASTHEPATGVRAGSAQATPTAVARASTAPRTGTVALTAVAGGAGSARPRITPPAAKAAMGPAPTPAPTAAPSSRPSAVVATAPPQTPNEQNTAEPAPTATSIPYLAPDAPPQILSFAISATTVHPGDVLSGSVTASSNVASVEVRVAGYSYNMVKTSPGEFALAVTVPNVPRIFRRTYPLVAIARNTRGDATQRTTQITIR